MERCPTCNVVQIPEISELEPEQITESASLILRHMEDADEHLRVLPGDLAGSKKAIRDLLMAACNLYSIYACPNPDDQPRSRWMYPLESALHELKDLGEGKTETLSPPLLS